MRVGDGSSPALSEPTWPVAMLSCAPAARTRASGPSFALALTVILVLFLSQGTAGAQDSPGSPRSVQSPVQNKDFTVLQHFVFIIKENRSFDNYFGTFPGADGATSGLISTGQRISLGRTPNLLPHDLGHNWTDAHRAVDNGKMDQFDLVMSGNVNNDFLSMTQYFA